MGEIRSFRDLEAWKTGMNLVECVYRLTEVFPKEEKYGLVSQMRRAAVSIPSNTAEGNAMRSPRWTLRFVLNAIGSACELSTQLELAIRLHLCTSADARSALAELELALKLLYGMRRERVLRLGAAGTLLALAMFAVVHLVR